MNFEITENSLDKVSTDAILVFVFQNDKDGISSLSGFNLLDKKLSGFLSKTIKIDEFSGKRGEIIRLYSPKEILSPRIFIIGLGKKKNFQSDYLRRSIGSFTKSFKKKINSVSLVLPNADEVSESAEKIAQAAAEGFLLGGYEFSKYKSKDKKTEKKLETIVLSEDKNNQTALKRGLDRAKTFAKATVLARDLVNEQAYIATPTYLANLAQDIARKDPKRIKLKIIDRDQAEKMGMHAFLGIARGSDTPPKFIALEYTPDKKTGEKLAIVGKGITFDSGGINVKGGDHMTDMKMDMSGAAVVLSVFSVISDLKPNLSVLGVIAATPNLISGKSIVPGDVVKALNEKTIEILNTDAEGRVTMADSLSFAVNEKATKIVDLATLTGAIMVALGDDIAGLFSSDEKLTGDLKKASMDAGEKIWEMPLEEDYKELNKSSVADIANIPSTRYGGAITAALFLQEFVGKIPWAHLDIAGPAFSSKGSDISEKGGTGFGVRTILNLLV